MNKRLSDAISRINELPEERQEVIATILLDVLEDEGSQIELTPEQIAELDRRLDDDNFASEEEVKEFFASLKG